jgi:hypothetical protein
MATRDILMAAKKVGLKVERVEYSWQPTPEESVYTCAVYFDISSADEFGIDSFREFDNSAQAAGWISDLKPWSAAGGMFPKSMATIQEGIEESLKHEFHPSP